MRFLSSREEDVTARASARFAAFLRSELEQLPDDHPLTPRYRRNLRRLDAEGRLRPRPVSAEAS